MIQVPSVDLPADVRRALAGYQSQVNRARTRERRVELATSKFKQYNRKSNPVFRKIRATLDSMCSGARRCMYCEDSAADEVEHHHPKNLYPDLVFDWTNYLFACGPCNTCKSNRFKTLLLHPRIENPLEFMTLDIAGGTFRFVPRARRHRRAEFSIELLQLNNRDYLPRARREGFGHYRARLREYIAERDNAASKAKLNLFVDALKRMQHPTVWHEMRRQRTLIPELGDLFKQAPEALTW